MNEPSVQGIDRAAGGNEPVSLITHLRVAPDPADANATILPDHAIAIRGDTIEAIGPTAELVAAFPGAPTMDGRGKLALPGAICAHTHFYGAFARGLAIPGPAPVDFPEILERLWWRLDRSLTLEDVRGSALVMLVDAVRHGCTTLFDHHASPNAVAGSLDAIGGAVKESGLRACLCYEVTDRDGPEVTAAGIAENLRWLQQCAAQPDPQLAGLFGLHAAMTLSNATLSHVVEAAAPLEAGFHIHAAEGPADQAHALANFGQRVIHRLHEMGILGERTLVAHAITIDESERELLASTGTWVSHQPRSNMNNAVGVADVPAMLADPLLGERVCLGNDGFSFNMFQEMKIAYLLHKVHTSDPRTLGGDQVMRMAYHNNARLAARFFSRPVGRLARGAFADIMLCDYQPFTPMGSGNLPWHILFGLDGSHVTDTIASGRLLMRDRQLLSLDEAAISARAMELAQDVWARFAG